MSKVGLTWTQALQHLMAVDLTALRLHITVSRACAARSARQRHEPCPSRRDFIMLLQTRTYFLLKFSMLDFQFHHTWPWVTETAESETVEKGTTAPASLVREPSPRCGYCFKPQCQSQTGCWRRRLWRVQPHLFGCLLIPLDNWKAWVPPELFPAGLLWGWKQIFEICIHLSWIYNKWHSISTVPGTMKPKVDTHRLTSRPSQTQGQQVHTGKCRKVW